MEVTGLIKGEQYLNKITPLMMASLKGNNELVEAFCKAGANVNYVSKEENSGTTYSGSGNGDHTFWKTTKSNTAVSLADANGQPATVALLRKYGGLGPKEIKKK